MKVMNAQQYADYIKGIEDFKTNIENWKGADDMAKIYASDRKQLMRIYNFIKEGKLRQARNEAYYLDTILRDQIPSVVYNHITATY
jgi:hypothetical protein